MTEGRFEREFKRGASPLFPLISLLLEGKGEVFLCHCEEHCDEAIFLDVVPLMIASLRSQ
jgi:hypothetical protein